VDFDHFNSEKIYSFSEKFAIINNEYYKYQYEFSTEYTEYLRLLTSVKELEYCFKCLSERCVTTFTDRSCYVCDLKKCICFDFKQCKYIFDGNKLGGSLFAKDYKALSKYTIVVAVNIVEYNFEELINDTYKECLNRDFENNFKII
jgi:hypothetical protein